MAQLQKSSKNKKKTNIVGFCVIFVGRSRVYCEQHRDIFFFKKGVRSDLTGCPLNDDGCRSKGVIIFEPLGRRGFSYYTRIR